MLRGSKVRGTFSKGWILSTGSRRGFLLFRFSMADWASAMAHLSMGWGNVFWTRSCPTREHWHQPQPPTGANQTAQQTTSPPGQTILLLLSVCDMFSELFSPYPARLLFPAIPNLPSLSINSFRFPKINLLFKSSKVSVSNSSGRCSCHGRELDMDGL